MKCLLLLFSSNLFSQNIELSVCQKDTFFETYIPNMVIESLNIYRFEDTEKYHISDKTIFVEGMVFKKVPTQPNDGVDFLFFSENKKGDVFLLDTIKNQSILYIPNEETEGFEIKKVAGFDLKIVGYHVRVQTPICKYNDAIMLLIKRTGMPDSYYESGEVNYYVRGIGFVASEYRGIIESYITRRYILDKKGNK